MPENKLRVGRCASKASPSMTAEDPTIPSCRAEKALAALSPEFGAWMDIGDVQRLDERPPARSCARIHRCDQRGPLFRAAHRHQGAKRRPFGYPAVASAAESLVPAHRAHDRIIGRDIPRSADRAARRRCARDLPRIRDIPTRRQLATALTKRLREVTDDFLIKENRDRPDVLKQLKGPSIVPR